MAAIVERVLDAVDRSAEEIVGFAADLIRVPTVNPPGAHYEDCARVIGDRLRGFGFDVRYLAAEGRPEHTAAYPRVNVIGRWEGARPGKTVHLNGHMDVVPSGDGWTVDPWGGVVRNGRVYGRGSSDMKGGIAAAVFAAEAVRRAGVDVRGAIEVSGTVDEESGGFAGVGWLAEHGYIRSGATDYVIIPEPLDVDRVCIGHRGVYWGEVTTYGHIAHGSMPFLGVSAIDAMGHVLQGLREELLPSLGSRETRVPVVPDGARRATLNINSVEGGQPAGGIQTPCVADRCRLIFDRRFLLEEGFERAKEEIVDVVRRAMTQMPGARFELTDLMVVHPVETPAGSPVIAAVERGIERVLGRRASRVASPGTYDHKHVTRIGGVADCIAYGPGRLELAHQPDEYCDIEDLVNATKVLALSLLDLLGA
jgi:succinyl-diaminopimelate desuccinylase